MLSQKIWFVAEVNPSPYADNYSRSGFAGVHRVCIHADPSLDGTAAARMAAIGSEQTNKQKMLWMWIRVPPPGLPEKILAGNATLFKINKIRHDAPRRLKAAPCHFLPKNYSLKIFLFLRFTDL